MTSHRLDNARWGFRSNCFACEASNPAGLGLEFFHDDRAHVVRADFNLGDAFSGAPAYVHGGIVLAVMDEAMAWAAIAIAHTWALTAQTSATFVRPVLVGQPHTVVAHLEARGDDGTLRLSAEVLRGDGAAGGDAGALGQGSLLGGGGGAEIGAELCATASATFVTLSAKAARAALGEMPDPEHHDYLRQCPTRSPK